MGVEAILLAAGRGLRLGPRTDARPKCLLEVAGRTLLARHLLLLRRQGAAPVTVVTGHRAEAVEAEVRRVWPEPAARTLRNDEYAHGSILSLQRGLVAAAGDLVFMDTDVLYHPTVLACLFETPHPTCVLVDGSGDGADEDMVVGARDGRAIHIGRRHSADGEWEVVGESVGFVRVGAADLPLLRRVLADTVAEGGPDQEWESALARFFALAPVAVERIDGLPWTEIDYPEDLRRAHEEIAPRLPPL
jgi:choline kinase